MTQEDHQLDVSHQQSSSVYNRGDDDDNNNQLNDDLHKKIFSKNITMIKANSVSIAAVGDDNDDDVDVGDIDIQKSLNNNVDGNDKENGTIIINRNIKSNMGAAYIIGSKEDEKTDESSTSPLVLLSSSLSSEFLSTSEDQLSSSKSLIQQSDQNQNQLIDDNNSTVNENLSYTTISNDCDVIKNDENKQNTEKDLVEQTALFVVGTSCDTDTVSENNNLKMTVIKPQANNENIREILQMKIENGNKNITDTNDVNNYGNNNEQKLENNVESVNEKNLNQLQSENDDYSKCLNDSENNLISGENYVKNEIEKNKSDNEVSLNNNSAEVKRKIKDKSIRQDQDDPIARLNALKANISNALKEVKAVLIEHGEPVIPEKPKQEQDNNCESSKDDGVVKFRFVKKIRRRSTFEDDKNAVTEIVINQIINNQNKSSESDNESETLSTETEEKIVESFKTQNKNDGSENSVDNGNKMPLVESELSKVKNVDDVLTKKNEEQTNEIVDEKNEQASKIAAKENEDKKTSKVKKLIKQNSKDDRGSVTNTGESQEYIEKNEQKKSVSESSKDDKKPVKVKKLVKRNSKDDTNSVMSTGESQASVEENELKQNFSQSSKDDKKTVKVKKLVKRNSKDNTNSAMSTGEFKASVEENESKKNVSEFSKDDKKPLKVKKLVKQNSKDESSSTVANVENSDLSKDDSKKNEKPPVSEDINDKNKIVKKVIGAKKSIKSTVATALDKVLATTNLKLPNERRASVATTTKTLEEPTKVALEKRRSSTTQTTLKANQLFQNLKTNSMPLIPKTIDSTAKSNDIKNSTGLSNENSNKAESKLENIKANQGLNLIETNTNKENDFLKQKISPENSAQNTVKLEKENIAPTLVQENEKPSMEVTKKETLEKVSKTLESNENEGSKASSESKSSIGVPNEKSAVQLAKNNSSASAKINEESSKSSNGSKNVDTKIINKDTIHVSDSKQPVDTSLETKQNQYSEHSTQNKQENTNNAVPETASSQHKTSQIITASSSEVIVDKNKEDNQSVFQQEDQATNLNSPVVRNEITAKLAELKRPPFKMPVINKSNVEASKIHPLMVLHITPPKNFSTTTFKTVPQKATATSSNKDNDNEAEINGEETNDKVSKLKRGNSKKVVIRRVKRRLSVDAEDKPLETEVEEKEIESKTQENDEQNNEEDISKTKSCLKLRVYEPGETVMYAERIKNTFKWKKATVLEKITSISYKVNINGEERPAHISCIKKYTDKKVHFGGKEYLEIDYARDEDDDDDEMERYNIWARV